MGQSNKDFEKDSDKKDTEKKEFDAGPFTSLQQGVSEEDFKHCVVNDLSLSFMQIAVKKKMYGQRFAIIGALDSETSTLHIFIFPSLPSTAKPADVIALEKKMEAKNCVVVAGPGGALGAVHDDSFKLARYYANEIKDSKLIKILKSNIKVGLSVTYTKNGFQFLERSTLNHSVIMMPWNSMLAVFFQLHDLSLHFDIKNNEFYGKSKVTIEFLLNRGLLKFPFDWIINITSKLLNEKLQKAKLPTQECFFDIYNKEKPESIKNSICTSYAAAEYWDKNIRYNKKIFSDALFNTIYIACSLREEKPGQFWTKLSDENIILNTLSIADHCGITFDFNEPPPEHQKQFNTGTTALMYAAKKNMFNIVKTLVERGAKIDRVDSEGKTAEDYTKDPKMKIYLKSLHNTLKLVNLIEEKKFTDAEDFLKDKAISVDFSVKCMNDLTLYAYLKASKNETLIAFAQEKIKQALIKSLTEKDYLQAQNLLQVSVDIKGIHLILQDFLVMSVNHNDQNGVKQLIQLGASPLEKDSKDQYPIERASQLPTTDIIKLLNSLASETLMTAAKTGDTASIKKLLVDTDITLQDIKGHTALDYAILNNHEETAAFLRSVFSTIYCIFHSDTKVFQTLLDSKNFDLDVPIYKGVTALGLLATLPQPQNTQLFKLALTSLKEAKKIDTEMTSDKVTALFLAVKSGIIENCLLLLSEGADPNLVLQHPKFKEIQSELLYELLLASCDKAFRDKINKYIHKEVSLADILSDLKKLTPDIFDDPKDFLLAIRQNDLDVIYRLLPERHHSAIPQTPPDLRVKKIQYFLQIELNNFLKNAIKENNLQQAKYLVESGLEIDVSLTGLILTNQYTDTGKYLRKIQLIREAFAHCKYSELQTFIKQDLVDIAKPIYKDLNWLAQVAQMPFSYTNSSFLHVVLNEIKGTHSIDCVMTSEKMTALFMAARADNPKNCLILLLAGANLQLVLDHPEFKKQITSPAILDLFDKWQSREKMGAVIQKGLDFLNTFIDKNICGLIPNSLLTSATKAMLEIQLKLDNLETQSFDPKSYELLIIRLSEVSNQIKIWLHHDGINDVKPIISPKKSTFKFFSSKEENLYLKQEKILEEQMTAILGKEYIYDKELLSIKEPLVTPNLKP